MDDPLDESPIHQSEGLPIRPVSRAVKEIVQIKPGDHVCHIYENAAEATAVAVPFIRGGLECGERCYYVADGLSTASMLDGLAKSGVDLAAERSRGALQILTKQDTYMRSGEFVPAAMIDFLAEAEIAARTDGFSGARIVGVMSWALDSPVSMERLVEYEAILDAFLEESRLAICCQYNRTRFDPALLHDILRVHPVIILGEAVCPNPYYEPPELILRRDERSNRDFKRQRMEWWVGQLKAALDAEQEREHDQETLREREEMIRLLLDSTGEAIYGIDLQGNCTLANTACVRLLGYGDPDELTGRNMHELTHHHRPDGTHYPEEECPIYQTYRNGEGTQDVEEVFWRADGTKFDVEYSSYPIRRGGQIVGAVVTFTEITGRKQTENALREINDKFQQLANHITDAFWIRSPDMSEVHYVSPAFERIWGRPVESLYANPQDWVEYILPEDRERVVAAFAALVREDPSLDIEYRIVRPGGEIRWVRVRGFQVRDAGGKLIRQTGIVTDITERRRWENALQESEERFRLLIENASDLITVLNDDGIIRFQSPSASRLLGYEPEEVVGRRCLDLIHPADTAHVAEEFKRALADSTAPVSVEYRFSHRRGGWRVLQSIGQSIPGEASDGFMIVNSRDVTEDLTSPQGGGETILIVDDESALRSVIETTLRENGYHVAVAGDGAEAIAIYAQRTNEIALVLTDIMMPLMDGVALSCALRRLNPQARIIASSGRDDDSRREQLKTFGVEAFLTKPYSAPQLLNAIHEALTAPPEARMGSTEAKEQPRP